MGLIVAMMSENVRMCVFQTNSVIGASFFLINFFGVSLPTTAVWFSHMGQKNFAHFLFVYCLIFLKV